MGKLRKLGSNNVRNASVHDEIYSDFWHVDSKSNLGLSFSKVIEKFLENHAHLVDGNAQK